jgi:hypothetical protein
MIENRTLSDVAQIIDCEHKTAPKAKSEDKYAYSIGTPALRLNYINLDEAKPVDLATYREWTKRSEPTQGDIILAREAPVGGVGIIGPNQKFCLGQRTVLIRANSEMMDSQFLYYYLQSSFIQNWMKDRSSGSTVVHLNVSDIRNIPINYLPSLLEQKYISSTINHLDLLAQHNRLFLKSISDHLMDLVTHFQRSRELVSLGSLYKVGLSGVWGDDAQSSKASIPVSVLRGKDLEDYFLTLDFSPPTRYLSNTQVESRKVAKGEIWTAGSGSLGPSLPITAETNAIGNFENLLYSNFVKRLVPISSGNYYGIAWLCMVSAWKKGEFQNYRSGTAMPNLDVDFMLQGVQVPLLSEDECLEINRLVGVFLSSEIRREINSCRVNKYRFIEILLAAIDSSRRDSVDI